jgi:hypothetical protein
VEDEEKYNQFDEVSFFVDRTSLNIIETKIPYSNVIPYARTDGEGKLVMYSSSLHIFYILLQCDVDIMSLNHYLKYVAETFNYHYVLFQLSHEFSISTHLY